MNIIKVRKTTLDAHLGMVRAQIKALQDSCPHSDVVRVPKSDTGNWDRGQDSYWDECSCPDCDKKWVEDKT